jgi:D-alanyl-D-alanine carboxypeptidase/D-alanyl-D-alanine-endopeptidase (penicillin-binding protein 4)
MERRLDLFPDFLASLPATGWEGTLKKRLLSGDSSDPHQGKGKGLIRAKTGTLSEPVIVASLAGYFRHPNHGLMAFCVIENGHPGGRQPNLGEIRDRQDGFMKRLLDLP